MSCAPTPPVQGAGAATTHGTRSHGPTTPILYPPQLPPAQDTGASKPVDKASKPATKLPNVGNASSGGTNPLPTLPTSMPTSLSGAIKGLTGPVSGTVSGLGSSIPGPLGDTLNGLGQTVGGLGSTVNGLLGGN